MKKKLTIHGETIRTLTTSEMQQVIGGAEVFDTSDSPGLVLMGEVDTASSTGKSTNGCG